MRIALLTDGIYPYVIGGIQKHSYYLAKYFAMNGVYVDLYHTRDAKLETTKLDCFSEEEHRFINCMYIPFPKLTAFPGHYVRESYQYSEAILKKYIQINAPVDFVYAQGFCGWKMIEKKRNGTFFPPIGLHFHGLEMFQPPPNVKAWLEQMLLRPSVLFNLKNADYVFSLGGKLSDILRSRNVPSQRILEIPLGIDKNWIAQEVAERRTSEKVFVFIGRNERRKGIKELNTALKQLKEQSNLKFNFIGPIPEESKIKSAHITYWGLISDPLEIRKILLGSDILVCPSHSEGMPNVIVEAMACGLAVIATDVGAVKALVSEKTGWLIDAPNPLKLKKAMEEAIQIDQVELQKKKINAKRHIEKDFLWENVIQKTIEVIQKIKRDGN